MSAVVATMSPYYNAMASPQVPWHLAEQMTLSVTVVVPGQQSPAGGLLNLAWDTTTRDLIAAVRAFAHSLALDHFGVDVAPDAITMFGGPIPTLADLGG